MQSRIRPFARIRVKRRDADWSSHLFCELFPESWSSLIERRTDSSKAGVPGATVTIINVGTNAQRVATTDTNGRISVPNLVPATYEIKVELSGFTTIVRPVRSGRSVAVHLEEGMRRM